MSLTETPSSFRSELLRKSETIHHGQSINRVQEDDTLQIRTLQQLNDPPEVKDVPRKFPFPLPSKKRTKQNNDQKVIVEVPIPVADRRRDYEYYDDEYYYQDYYYYDDNVKDNNNLASGDNNGNGDKNAAKRRIHKNDPQEYVSSAIAQNSYQVNNHPQQQQQQQQPPLTRRVANAVFSNTGLTVLALIGVPVALAAAYWLFVINGPTPVVRARQIFEGNQLEYFLERVVQALQHQYHHHHH